jgi:hypothetical protein
MKFNSIRLDDDQLERLADLIAARLSPNPPTNLRIHRNRAVQCLQRPIEQFKRSGGCPRR